MILTLRKKDPVKYKQSNTVNWCFLTIEDLKDMGFFLDEEAESTREMRDDMNTKYSWLTIFVMDNS